MDRRCGGMEFRRGAVLTVPDPPRVGATHAVPSPDSHDLDTWIEAFRQTSGWQQPGITPLADQLIVAKDQPPALVVLVGIDRYPPFAIRTAIQRTWPREAIAGLQLIRSIVGTPPAIATLPRSVPGLAVIRRNAREHNIKRLALDPIYPVADPTLVAWHAATAGRRKLRPGQNPAEVGLVLIDPWLCVRLGRWLHNKTLDTARPVWIARHPDDCRGSIHWLTPGQIPQQLLTPEGRAILGDPLSGVPMNPQAGIPADAETAFIAPASKPAPAPEPCITCGWCAEVCPTHLRPIELVRRIDAGKTDSPSLDWCLDCGLCTRVCPSGIDLATPLRSRHNANGGTDDG
ncbi:MAG: 4Fe-4S dicluster domain-containing protein [Phycisphaeraceae bacterium]